MSGCSSRFAEEMAVAAPGTAVAAVFDPNIFGPDVSESAIIIEAIRAGVQDFLRRPISSIDLEQLIDRLVRRSVLAPRRLGKTVLLPRQQGGRGQVHRRRQRGVRAGACATRRRSC